jgi:hypothetical protein
VNYIIVIARKIPKSTGPAKPRKDRNSGISGGYEQLIGVFFTNHAMGDLPLPVYGPWEGVQNEIHVFAGADT